MKVFRRLQRNKLAEDSRIATPDSPREQECEEQKDKQTAKTKKRVKQNSTLPENCHR